MNTSDITNNSVDSIVVAPSTTDVLVLDVTVVHTADTLVDADGVGTTGAGTSALTAGTTLYDLTINDLVFTDDAGTPTKVWKEFITNGKYTAAESAGTTVGADGDTSAPIEALTNAKVTAGLDNSWDANEGVFVSADTSYDGSDTIIKGTALSALTAGKVSGADGVWAGDTTEGVWDDVGGVSGILDGADVHITTETLKALDQASTTTLYFTVLDGIAVGDVLTD